MRFEDRIGVSSWDSARIWLRTYYVKNEVETKRKADAFERDEFYEGRGEPFMERLVERAWQDERNRQVRKALLAVTKWNNVTSRIVNEKATVYSEPARRSVKTDEPYQNFLRTISPDEIMRELNRKLALHEDVLVMYRVREHAGKRYPTIDLISPSMFWAISPLHDQTLHIATLLEQKPTTLQPRTTDHHYRLWTDTETIALDGELNIIKREAWPLGRMPGFIASTRPPTGKQRLLALTPCADLIVAHKAVWFQDLILFKESKSTNKQTYHSGDMNTAAMGQTADTENSILLPEGVITQAIDRGMDLKQFRDNADHILERAGANHGLPPSVLHHRDSSSGAEIMLRRLPLRELRSQQILVMRRVERETAEIESLVNASDLTEFAFSTDGWNIDFGEVQQPLSEQERDQVFEKRRQLMLTSTVEEERKRNPDLRTDQEAIARIAQRVADEAKRLELAQELQALNASMGSEPGARTPQDNGEGETDNLDDVAKAKLSAV